MSFQAGDVLPRAVTSTGISHLEWFVRRWRHTSAWDHCAEMGKGELATLMTSCLHLLHCRLPLQSALLLKSPSDTLF